MDFLAIVGPTASGKTALSLQAGRALDAEIVSMDSRQIYRGMDIGTGKVSLRERALLPHHGLDILDPDEPYSAGQFSRDARTWIRDIRGRGRTPLLVGGTGFFLRSLMEPMFREPDLDPHRLGRLRAFLTGMELEQLVAFVRILDPERAEAAEKGGRQRLTRAVEMALLTGRPISRWHRESAPGAPPLRGLVVLVEHPREMLYQRINSRVGAMVGEGFLEEVERLVDSGYSAGDPGMTGAGYREMLAVVSGEATLDEATEKIRQSHRNYARRQMTWFRHQLPVPPLVVEGGQPLERMARTVLDAWERKGTTTG